MHSPLRSHFYFSYLILPERIIFHTKNRYHTHATIQSQWLFVAVTSLPLKQELRKWNRNEKTSSKITIRFQYNCTSVLCLCVCAFTEDTKEPGIIVKMKTNEEKNIIALNDIELNAYKKRSEKWNQDKLLIIKWGKFDTSSFHSPSLSHFNLIVSRLTVRLPCLLFFLNGSQQFILLKETLLEVTTDIH